MNKWTFKLLVTLGAFAALTLTALLSSSPSTDRASAGQTPEACTCAVPTKIDWPSNLVTGAVTQCRCGKLSCVVPETGSGTTGTSTSVFCTKD
jgi:hypothetical protein